MSLFRRDRVARCPSFVFDSRSVFATPAYFRGRGFQVYAGGACIGDVFPVPLANGEHCVDWVIADFGVRVCPRQPCQGVGRYTVPLTESWHS